MGKQEWMEKEGIKKEGREEGGREGGERDVPPVHISGYATGLMAISLAVFA